MRDNIFFTQEYIQNLKNTSDDRLKKLVDNLLALCEQALEMKVYSEDELTNNGETKKWHKQHENYYEASTPFYKNMPLLGFGYYYTNDERYFEKAKALMLAAAEYEKWCGRGYIENGMRGELVTGHFCIGMAVGYELFKDKLTDDERKCIVDSTYRLGILSELEDWILPGTRVHAFDTMGHNWWVVCVSSAAMAAIIMKDEIPGGEKLAKMSAEGLKEWFLYQGNPINAKPCNIDNGGYYESVTYFDYALMEYLKFATVYKKITGIRPFDDVEIFKKSADFFVNTYYPSDENYFVPFGDCGAAPKGVMSSAIHMIQYDIDLPTLRWYLQSAIGKDFSQNNQALKNNEIALQAVLAYDKIYNLPCEKPTETSCIYDKIGWAVFRDSFEKNANLLAVKCGDTWNHAHADAAHFVFYKNGVPEIYDSCTSTYGNEAYIGYFVTSKAHNVILYNKNGQDIRDIFDHVRMRGRLYNFVNEDGFKYVCADATGPMARYFRRHLRHFLWLDKFIVIYDDIECYEEGEVSFLLHAKENNSFKMLTECNVTECEGLLGNEAEKKVKYLSYNKKTDSECRVKFVSVIAVDESIVPKFSMLNEGYKVSYGDTNVFINLLSDGRIMHRNCFNEFEGIKTDAIMVIENKGRYGTVNGSIIRKGKKSILENLSRITGWV